MKRRPIFLYLAVWSFSLVAAYYIGSRAQEDSSVEPSLSAPSPIRTTANSARAEVQTDTMEYAVSAENPLDTYLSGEPMPLEEALRAIPTLSAEESRLLLSNAFALATSDPNRPQLIRELLSQLARTEPLAALEIASGIASLRDGERARVAILEVWGRSDPAAAIAWAQNALAGEPVRARSSQLSAIYRGYAATNPEAAFAQAMSMDENARLKNRLLGEIIETQIQTGGLQAARIAVDAISDPTLRDGLRRDLVNEWAEFDPAAAAAYVSSLGDDASQRLKTTLVSEWAESDPVAAAAWLSSLAQDDPAIARGSAAIIREWTRYDLAASAEWLNSLPASPELDRAVVSYTFRAAEEDPETAMTWAASIENDRRRSWMMERVAGTWKEQDAQSFENYLNESEFTQEQRDRLENAQNRGGGWGRGW
ncbi:MAG: hypothetical protein EA353_06470 [Puniceicoccaceae bacterium]|nr:MAG: hypothetical protein EA353_06470 [Puniceicoccaceae bacterium]